MLELSGTINRVRYRGENGFAVGEIALSKESFKKHQEKLEELFHPHRTRQIPFAGICDLDEDSQAILTGDFVHNPKFGNQFRVSSAQPDMDIKSGGLQNYIANHPDLHGIGSARARKLVENYGEKLTVACCEHPETIATFLGVQVEIIVRLSQVLTEDKAVFAARTWLAGFGISHNKIEKIVSHYGSNTVALLKQNPYLLIDEIETFGFKRVDEIARKIGIQKDDPLRIREGVIYSLQEEERAGHTWTATSELIDAANKLLILDRLDSKALIMQELEKLADETADYQRIKIVDGKASILKTYEREQWLRGFFAFNYERRNCHFPDPDSIVLPGGLDPNGQQQFVINALRWQISVGTGGAGTGKTYAIRALIELYESFGLEVVCCAPTGKAARRISQLTRRPAETIHKLLCFDGDTFHADEIEADVIIIDEASMIDIDLAWRLFTIVDPFRQAVIIVGDHNQLPPVGCGYLLRDLVEKNLAQCTVLETVIRQAGTLKRNSTAILNGTVRETPELESMIEEFETRPKDKELQLLPWYLFNTLSEPGKLSDFIAEMFEQYIEGRFALNPLSDVQVLCPMKKGEIGTQAINALIQRILQKKLYGRTLTDDQVGKIQQGDKVIQIRNNRDIGIMNGTLGIVERIDPDKSMYVKFEFSEDRLVQVRFEDQVDIRLAYALTVHKAQGSEFPLVVVICHRSHYIMLSQNLLYTAVTRARNYCVILGDKKGIDIAAKTTKHVERRTWLGIR